MFENNSRTEASVLAVRFGWRKAITTFLVLLGLVLIGVAPMAGQTYLQAQGASRSTTTVPIENGWIDASNGRLHLDIPLGSYPQRAGRTNSVALMYDSNIWTLSGTSWQPGGQHSWGGWGFVTGGDPGTVTETDPRTDYRYNCDGSTIYDYRYDNYSNFIWTAPDGTAHSFAIGVKYDNCLDTYTSGAAYATDGTGYYMVVNGLLEATVSAPDGTVDSKDSNGNYYVYHLTYVGSVRTEWYVDTLGRTAEQLVTDSTTPNTIKFQVLNAQGTMSTYTGTTATINVSTNIAVGTQTNYTQSLTVMQSLQLPDTTTYTFKYDCDPTASGNNSTICAAPICPSAQARRVNSSAS